MDYVLGDVLYTGANARVVAGARGDDPTPVVLKIPRRGQASEPTVARLRHEYTLLRAFDLPGVIRALELVPHGDGVALVLERWGDGSLDRLLSHGPLELEAALRLGAALGRTLGQVHREGVIHRDIKPQNILVNAACTEIRLIDFGLATHGSGGAAGATAGELLGTLAYMAPEQTGRMKHGVDARADLYALGGTLYQMLTGELPFETTDDLSLIHAQMARRPPPPHERAPARRLPEQISAIVMKLLEKNPEQRYQTADGLACDLERALDLLRQGGEIGTFVLGERDWEDRIRRPSRLFGREQELRALTAAYRYARGGAVRLALVAGPSGVGKSALVGALYDDIRTRAGIFAAGKFDLLQRGTPHAALSQAFRALARRRLAGSAEELAYWKWTWEAALGPSARILVDLAPELASILGEPKELLELGPAEAKNRFQLTVIRFVRVTASAEHPLVLFIDDLQWADAASLALLEAIVTDPEVRHMIMIGTYRDGEVPPGHPLHALVAASDRAGRYARTIVLGPLDEQALDGMVADMLRCDADQVRSLCALVKAKTDGSPFFVEQFLRALHERRILRRDLATGRWGWDTDAIERMGVSDNVAALLLERMDRLPPPLRRILAVAACAGAEFVASLLRDSAGLSDEVCSRALEGLLQEGLLLRAGDGEAFAFVHDRLQQAAYDAIPEDERLELHLSLAHTLDRRWSAQREGAALFAMLFHYLRATPRLTEPALRRHVAERCLLGGVQAKVASAYAEAVRFLRAGRELVGEASAADPDPLAFEIDLALTEASFLSGPLELGEALFAACQREARDAVARGRVAKLRAALLVIAGRYREALEIGLVALEELGWTLPRAPEALQASFAGQMARVVPMLAAATPDSFCALPRCTDPAQRTAAELFPVTILGATVGQPELAPSQMFSLLESTFVHGLSSGSMFALGAAALLFTSVLQELELGTRCVELTFACRSLPGMLVGKSLVSACLPAQFVHPDLDFVYQQWRDASEICWREGDMTHAETAECIVPAAEMGAGRPLSRCVIPDRPWRDIMASEFAAAGRAAHGLLTAADLEDPRAAIQRCAALPTAAPLTHFYTVACVAFAAVHLGEDREALRLAVAIDPLWMSAWCNPPTLWQLKILTILGATLPDDEDGPDDARHAAFAVQRARLAELAAANPPTFRHALWLVEAGEARRDGQHEQATRLYEQAIEHAARHGFVHDEALALRLCGEHLLARGFERMARAYLSDAYDAYVRWEAPAPAAVLRRKHPQVLLPAEGALSQPPLTWKRHSRTRGTLGARGQGDDPIDFISLLKAAQALSGDREPDSLLARMLRLLAENAGAERAVLVLARADRLVVRAALVVEPEQLTLYPDEPALDSAQLPASAVWYVARGHEPLVLGLERGDGRFDGDPYLKQRRPASLLLVPLSHQGRLLGVLVLEHISVAGAFPEARVEVIALLAAQAAAAVENAQMYAELTSSHQRLERLVAERTAELRAAKEAADAGSRAKSDFLASMSHELRTPLIGVLGYAQILERAPDLSAERQAAARLIRASGEHLLTLITDVLDVAKIEAGKLELSPQEVRFAGLVRTVHGICQPRAEAKGIGFRVEEEGAPIGTVLADPKRLMQVLLNLLGNAIKFTARGQVVLRIAADPASGGAPRRVCFAVEDTGVGIAAEHIERIFEPFEQAGAAAVRAEGTGLGLSITRRLVELMGGTLAVESQLGRGSVFTFELPLVEVHDALPGAQKPASWERIAGYEGARRVLLVVDDRPENRAVLRDMLVPLGFRVLEASGGEQALELSLAHRPDAVVMDLNMPEMDGYEATRRLRRVPELAGLVVIACSASVSASVRERSASAGCNAFLPKPFAMGPLLELLADALGIVWSVDDPSLPAAPVSVGAATGVRPPPAVLTALLDLADKGRVRGLVKEAERLRHEDPRLGPFLEQLRAISMTFQTDALRKFLSDALAQGEA